MLVGSPNAACSRRWLSDVLRISALCSTVNGRCKRHIPTGEGWLYLAVILDLFTRKAVGWAMRDHVCQQLTIAALTMAIQRQRPARGLLHHSDRGSQYAAGDYRASLKASGIVPSMSRKGNCWDNAPMESWFHTLKTELVHHAAYATREAAKRDLFAYIEGYYNRQRLHSALGYLTPEQAELQAAQPGVRFFGGTSEERGHHAPLRTGRSGLDGFQIGKVLDVG